LVWPLIQRLRAEHPQIELRNLVHETVRAMIGAMIGDLVAETRSRLTDAAPGSADDVRAAGRPLAGFSPAMEENVRQLRAFLHARMYRNWGVNRMRSKARRLVRDL